MNTLVTGQAALHAAIEPVHEAPHFKLTHCGSRRRRLWELPIDCHDAILGVCLPVADLRLLIDKVFAGQSGLDDYRFHTGLVAQCNTRNKVSEVLQRELERRLANTVRRFSAAKTAGEVAVLWAAAAEVGEFAGALWAGLTHARCDAALHSRICHDFHMFQFQAVVFAGADLAGVDELVAENQVLARELGRVQQRHTQWQVERHAERSEAHADLLRLRTELVAKDALIAQLRAAQEQPATFAMDRASRLARNTRSAELAERLAGVQRALDQQMDENTRLRAGRGLRNPLSGAQTSHFDPAAPGADADMGTDAGAAVSDGQRAALATASLQSRSVLCVGGRSGHIPVYRDLVERHGGRFAHHDGGIEDNAHRLEGYLAAADLVICQTGCLSHNAYWRVKDHCKRTGKQCVYVEKPGVGSFLRGLAQVPASPDTPSGSAS